MMAAPKAAPGGLRAGFDALWTGLVSAALVIGLYFQGLLFSLGSFWRDPFDGRLILWILEHGRQKLLRVEVASYFQSIQFFPYKNSLAFSDSLIGMAPIYTLWRIGVSEIVALNLTLITVLAIAAVLVDRQLKALDLAPLARVLATVVALSSFPMFAVMGHFQLFGLLFAPVVMLLIARILLLDERGLYPELFLTTGFGTAIAMYLPFMLAFLLLPLGAIYWRRLLALPKAITRKDVAAAGLFGLAMAILMVPYVRLQKGFAPIPLPEVQFYAARLSSFFLLTPVNFLYPNLSLEPGDSERSYSPGAVSIICLLAATVIVFRALARADDATAQRRLRLLGFAGLVFVIAWGLSLGPYVEIFGHRIISPVGVLQKHIPALRVIRAPGRFSIFFTLHFALVFAMGVSNASIRGKMLALALVFCVFQIPRADLIAKEARILRADACLKKLGSGDVASVVPLANGGHLDWINARIDHMLLMLPYKARIFDGYGNRDTPELQRVTHIERLFRGGELSASDYRRNLLDSGATHIVILNDAVSDQEAARFDAVAPATCRTPAVSVHALSRAP
ncbi:hypothetical protein [Bosea sp. UNC402CLCol]|uniref:hypothetical protein n=1 Tax=Bosea sp. UNC402CLCol TaxID=1510531 RepID=UPI00056DF4C9|nr:hypothetical protein [Bosea sp. UNC402CLCol]